MGSVAYAYINPWISRSISRALAIAEEPPASQYVALAGVTLLLLAGLAAITAAVGVTTRACRKICAHVARPKAMYVASGQGKL